MSSQKVAASVLVLALLPAAARADEGPRFGGAGELVLSDDQPLGGFLGVTASSTGAGPVPPSSSPAASFEFATVSDGGGSGASFAIAPALDYFVSSGFSLGADVVFGVFSPAHPDGTIGVTDTYIGLAPRIGYNVALSDGVSVWPKLSFQYTTVSQNNNGPSANATSIGLFVPILFHPVRRVFLGVGPNFSTELSTSISGGVPANVGGSGNPPKVTTIGVQVTFGAWLFGSSAS